MHKTCNVVFESPTKWHKWLIMFYVWRGFRVWVIESFPAYHHEERWKYAFLSQPSFPAYVDELLRKRKIFLLKAEDLAIKDLHMVAMDKALASVEKAFPLYRKEFQCIIKYVCETISAVAENIFKKMLCSQLAVFYSVNIMLHKIKQVLPQGPIKIYPEANMLSYFYYEKLILRAGQTVFRSGDISFMPIAYLGDFLESIKYTFISILKLLVLTLTSGCSFGRKIPASKHQRKYRFGIALVAPLRQLRNNQRRADFMVDGIKIRKEDTVYLPLVPLSKTQKSEAARLKGEVFYLPAAERYFLNFKYWLGLVRRVLTEKFLRNGALVNEAFRAFCEYFRWKKAMEEIELKHFVTYCDFGGARIARNIALNQAGVKTWYFTDSMNNGVLWVDTIKGFKGLHTFWAYLYYDCFVTWNDLLAQYYLQHPTLIKKAYVVGCLWSDHVSKKAIRHENESAKFVIAAFDSTYSQNGKASYQEGLAFAEHLLRLVDACPEVFLAFKEKKRREIHAELDAVQGPRLVALYETMRAHPKIKVYSNQDDAADLISTADMVIAFPFTSVTFEALSASKPAVWHDPLGYYKDTPYGKAGVVTHSYEELKAKVLEVMALPSGKFQSPLPKNSPLSDPYCDGKAIDRFRDLLVADL